MFFKGSSMVRHSICNGMKYETAFFCTQTVYNYRSQFIKILDRIIIVPKVRELCNICNILTQGI